MLSGTLHVKRNTLVSPPQSPQVWRDTLLDVAVMSSQFPTNIGSRALGGLFIGVVLDSILVSFSTFWLTRYRKRADSLRWLDRNCDSANLYLLPQACKVSESGGLLYVVIDMKLEHVNRDFTIVKLLVGICSLFNIVAAILNSYTLHLCAISEFGRLSLTRANSTKSLIEYFRKHPANTSS